MIRFGIPIQNMQSQETATSHNCYHVTNKWEIPSRDLESWGLVRTKLSHHKIVQSHLTKFGCLFRQLHSFQILIVNQFKRKHYIIQDSVCRFKNKVLNWIISNVVSAFQPKFLFAADLLVCLVSYSHFASLLLVFLLSSSNLSWKMPIT